MWNKCQIGSKMWEKFLLNGGEKSKTRVTHKIVG
jgi:hypothetical protein